ncbi:GNAT family N-acetyltransferase [Fusibacter bizertensis]|uniref:GNAT family N-acetyltransferase n=1 Tax=Fusibacter bizertensis TaxID=1488331 RepID=A0ABT6N8Z0_9FIRM|nr:GNAT family N-acetyltransferase [Fusibacter bizertensis]MDH8676864.1 GNAT family N-acetyltransferase [Fusibacter bizertensis]
MIYRELELRDVEKIKMIDATCFIEKAWRIVDEELKLIEINWTDHELPNGLKWHMDQFSQTIQTGGKGFGCFVGDTLIGYTTVNSDQFGNHSKYVLLDQLFISKDYRNKGIGKQLFYLCADQAKKWGAEKLYLCAGSSEDTIAFYKMIGCVGASEIDQELYDKDPNDRQLEYHL